MPSVPTIRDYVQLTRPQNASGSVLTYSIGYFLVVTTLSYDFFIGLLILLALHSLATVQNDIADVEIDRANKRRSVLQTNSLTISNAKFFVQVLALTALVFALLSPHRRLHLMAITGLLVIAWLYNISPIRASKRPILSIAVMGLSYVVLPFIYGYFVANGRVSTNYFFVFVLLWFLVRVSTSILKDFKDAVGDKIFKKETFYLHFGRLTTAWTSIIASVVAYIGLLAVLLALKPKTVILFVTLSLASLLVLRNIIYRTTLLRTKNEERLNRIFHTSVFRHNQFEAAFLLCLILS